MYAVAVAVLALAVAVQSSGRFTKVKNWRRKDVTAGVGDRFSLGRFSLESHSLQALPTDKLTARGGRYGEERGYDHVTNIRLSTINNGNHLHESASAHVSRSRQDTYSNSESASLVNKYQKVVNSDTYVHRDTLIEKPLTVNNHHHHHQTDVVKQIQPIQNNLWVEEKQKIVEPEEAEINTNSESVSRKTIVKPTIVNNEEEKVRLETIVKPTKWVEAEGGYEGRGRGSSNEGYDR